MQVSNHNDFSALDHSYIFTFLTFPILTFPILTEKFLASKTWITCHALGHIGYTNHTLNTEEILDNTQFLLMPYL